MRIAAFDMGIKNFAFVVMDTEDDYVRWLDLSDLSHSADIYRNLIHHLNSFNRHWRDVDTVLIEQQMNRHNIGAARLACHVMAFFYHCHPHVRVIEYPSSYKTRYTQGGNHLEYRARKSFAVAQVMNAYEDKDPVLIDWILSLSKKDDIADCILMGITFPRSPLWKQRSF
jgi:hypothetical protein